MSGSTVTSSTKAGFVQPKPFFIGPQKFQAMRNQNKQPSTRLFYATLDDPIAQDKEIKLLKKPVQRNDLQVQNFGKSIYIDMKKTSCIHPGKDPKCNDCPAKNSKFDAKYLEIHNQESAKANSLYIKSICIHPGISQKCNDCPNRQNQYVMSNVEILQAKSKCAHPGKNPPCNNCPEKLISQIMAQNQNSFAQDKNIDIDKNIDVLFGESLNKSTMEDNEMKILMGKTKCIHPGKDPKCNDCPEKPKMQNTVMISDPQNIFGKTKCIHPGKDPKCNDCPEKPKIQNTVLIQDPQKIFGKTKCIHPGKDPKCNDCPDKPKMQNTATIQDPQNISGKTKCIHPGKDPKCNDCPEKLKMQNSIVIQDLKIIFGKTQCIHPGKNPKCNDCPDRKKNSVVSFYKPPNKELTQSLQKLIAAGK